MKIGIEAERANNPQKTGVEHYAKQLILHLAEIDHENEYVLYLRTAPEPWLTVLPQNFTVKVLPFPIFWTQIRLSVEMLLNPVDLLFIPASALPLIHPRNSVVTIHDLAWKFYPDTFTPFNRMFLEWSTRFAVRSARSIISVSESTKKDLRKFYSVSENTVAVVHHGYEEVNQQSGGYAQEPSMELPKKYILFLSTLQPRKNLEALIDAFAELKIENPELPHQLVVVGKPGWKYETILKKINDHRNFVRYLNHVSDADRLAIMRRSELLVLPSFYEGFGMQILEAFSAGVPVATSNISSLPEVAGEAAVYFNPLDTREMKNAIKSVLNDKSLADSLREKARKRLLEFSWKKCAEQTLGIFTSLT